MQGDFYMLSNSQIVFVLERPTVVSESRPSIVVDRNVSGGSALGFDLPIHHQDQALPAPHVVDMFFNNLVPIINFTIGANA